MNHCSLTGPSVVGSTALLRRERLNQNVSPPTAASSDAHRKYDRIIISWGEAGDVNVVTAEYHFYRAQLYCPATASHLVYGIGYRDQLLLTDM